MIEILKKIWAWVVSIPQDKLLHDYAGALVCLYGFAVVFTFAPFWWAFCIGNLLAVAALGLKEWYDWKHPEGHSVEWKDVAFGLFGVAKVDLSLLLILAGL